MSPHCQRAGGQGTVAAHQGPSCAKRSPGLQHALTRSTRYSFNLQGSSHATSRVAGLVAPWAEAWWNSNFIRDLLETRLQIELWCNYELFLCVLQDWATCHWAQSTVHQGTTGEPDSAASPPLSLN